MKETTAREVSPCGQRIKNQFVSKSILFGLGAANLTSERNEDFHRVAGTWGRDDVLARACQNCEDFLAEHFGGFHPRGGFRDARPCGKLSRGRSPRGVTWLLQAFLCFLKKMSELRFLTTLYLAKNDHRWVTFSSRLDSGIAAEPARICILSNFSV